MRRPRITHPSPFLAPVLRACGCIWVYMDGIRLVRILADACQQRVSPAGEVAIAQGDGARARTGRGAQASEAGGRNLPRPPFILASPWAMPAYLPTTNAARHASRRDAHPHPPSLPAACHFTRGTTSKGANSNGANGQFATKLQYGLLTYATNCEDSLGQPIKIW
jgi:hypothetical protein